MPEQFDSSRPIYAQLVSLLADAVLCGVYFAAANWLMKNKLDLE